MNYASARAKNDAEKRCWIFRGISYFCRQKPSDMEIKVSEELNGIIKYAVEEAMRTGSYGIGPDHLFLGIIRHEESAPSRALQGLGIDAA